MRVSLVQKYIGQVYNKGTHHTAYMRDMVSFAKKIGLVIAAAYACLRAKDTSEI